jgi:hypothetical protein
MLVIAFDGAELKGEIAAELDRLRETDTIRVLDAVAVVKDEDGQVRMAEGRGGAVGDIGRRLADGGDAGGAGLNPTDRSDLQDVADSLPPGSAAAVALLEHRWAIPLQEAIQRAGGRSIVDSWVTPEDLAGLGLGA